MIIKKTKKALGSACVLWRMGYGGWRGKCPGTKDDPRICARSSELTKRFHTCALYPPCCGLAGPPSSSHPPRTCSRLHVLGRARWLSHALALACLCVDHVCVSTDPDVPQPRCWATSSFVSLASSPCALGFPSVHEPPPWPKCSWPWGLPLFPVFCCPLLPLSALSGSLLAGGLMTDLAPLYSEGFL